ncbi:uncharacterized WD repeat-containing protein alr2800-like [Ruditapes philippinarum]|uniref:uncharacterized WD repeat-containing protein alr2800-like n=1 Tax=Ruditapes philippinarum TaxID=129788 RepID=UPI00295AE9EA|nr:uncharacterized WD repeat-containing protein alr2800-like [Ruditapes philippinarum]
MQDIYDHVSSSKKEIEAIKVHLSNDRPRDKLFFYPPNRITSFVGRKEELKQLQERFFEKKYGCNMQILCGLGGVGKTTLSIEYAWNSHALYPGGVFWMSAETNESLEDSIQKIALDTDNVGNDTNESMRKTLNWLRGLQQGWLLVIDNLDMEEIKGNVKELVLGAWRHNSNGQTIITSRRKATNAEEEFYVQADDCITLDVLTEKESLHFITTRTGLQINNDENAICLVHELGGLPLALEQAAAHIKALACTYKEYFNKFKEQRLKLLKAIRPPFELSKERQAVQTTWQLNFDYILKQSEHEGLGNTAVTIVEILAYLYAEDIPFCVINTGTPKICDEKFITGSRKSTRKKANY